VRWPWFHQRLTRKDDWVERQKRPPWNVARPYFKPPVTVTRPSATQQLRELIDWHQRMEREKQMAKFKIGDRVKTRSGIIGHVVNEGSPQYRVRAAYGEYYWCASEFMEPWQEIKVGQRVRITSVPHGSVASEYIGYVGTVHQPEFNGIFAVRLGEGTLLYCARSMVQFLEPLLDPDYSFMYLGCDKAKKPLLDQTFITTSYQSSDARCIGQELYDVTLKGVVKLPGNCFSSELKLTLDKVGALADPAKKFRVTVTEVEEPTPLPCPCCGTSNYVCSRDFPTSIYCVTCSLSITGKTFAECAAKWNRRCGK